MGELRTRKRGTKWEYSFEGAPVAGKRKTISKSGFRTKTDAIKAGTEAMNQYNNAGVLFSPTEISLADYLDYLFDNYCKMSLKYNTQLGYIQIIEGHLKPQFGAYKLKALQPAAIQEYVNSLKLHGLARNSVTGILSVLSAAYEYALSRLDTSVRIPVAGYGFLNLKREQQNGASFHQKNFSRFRCVSQKAAHSICRS